VIDTNQDLLNYFLDEVQLKEDQKQKMRDRRNANRTRLRKGLLNAKKPAPHAFVIQGSYAMHSMVQANAETSDIDDGVAFMKADLVGPRGGDYTPLEAKRMVRDALDDGSFTKAPEVHTNCVRIFYNDGFNVDVPVYRKETTVAGFQYELASSEWKKADPEAVTSWFNKNVNDKSPDSSNGRQMRRLVRLLKAWGKSRASWNMPSGFILSVLVNETFFKNGNWLDRDDRAFLYVLTQIYNRVCSNRQVMRPVEPYESITKTQDDANMRELRDRLKDAIATLSVLEEPDCDRSKALKAYRTLFCTEYFDEEIAELEKLEKQSAALITVTGNEPKAPFIKKGGEGSYA
jgi:hypothetical protein